MIISYLNKPGTDTAVNKRRTTAPAVRIWVNDWISLNKFSFVLKALHNIFICILYKYALIIRYFFCKLTFSVNWFNVRNSGALEYLVIFFTKGWSNMNDTSTVFCRNVVCIEHAESTLFALLAAHFFAGFWILELGKIWEKWLIFSTKEFLTLVAVDDFVSIFALVICRKAGFSKNIVVSAFLIENLYIVDIRSHTKTEVWWQSPWSCCPCEEVCFSVCHVRIIYTLRSLCNLKTNSYSLVLNILIALCKLVSRKYSRTAWTVWKNVFSFINKSLVPERFCNPPDRFHELRVHSFVVVVKVYPASHTGNSFAPFWSIFENWSLTCFVKFINSVTFNFVLRV